MNRLNSMLEDRRIFFLNFFFSLILGALLIFNIAIDKSLAANQNNSHHFLAFPIAAEASVGIPEHLIIPSLKINTAIEEVGLSSSGELEVPKKSDNVGWYQLGPRPGEAGNAVIDGHLDTSDSAAVFWNLKKLKPGDEIDVLDGQGKKTAFKVDQLQSYNLTQAPMDQIFGASDSANLNLITCDGTWNEAMHTYTKRLVVYAEKM